MPPTVNVKGLFKGLAYFAHIFEEKEMEIGFPTDVKHVAHIGIDGPSASKPSWMKDFKAADENSTEQVTSVGMENSSPIKPSVPATEKENQQTSAETKDTEVQKLNEIPPKSRRKSSASSNGSPVASPARKNSDGTKVSRRTRSGISSDPMRQGQSGSSKSSRRHKSSNLGPGSTSQEGAAGSKNSSQRKSKGGSGSGSSRSSRSRECSSLTDLPFSRELSDNVLGLINKESRSNSIVDVPEEKRENSVEK